MGETTSSRQDRFDHLAVDVGKPEATSLVLEGETFVIDAHEVHDGGLPVVDVDGVLDDVVAEVVRLPEIDATSNAPSGEPHGEAAGVVVSGGVMGG